MVAVSDERARDRALAAAALDEQRQVSPGTVPDMGRLWLVVQRCQMAQVDALTGVWLWRIAADDWQSIRVRARNEVGVDAQGRGTLFGVPVEVVQPAPGRWPELVLVVNRRV